MDAISTGASEQDYASLPPILVIGRSAAAVDRARGTAAIHGMRIAALASLEEAPERIRHQARASALWIELESDGGASLDRLLAVANREAEDGRCPAIVAAPLALVDPLVAQLSDSVQLVIDGSDADRAAALALALANAEIPGRLSDVASDRNTVRLRQLSDEVSRIAATLARLSADPVAGGPEIQKPTEGEIPDVPVDIIRSVIRARRLRSRYFSEELFADPAWDMLLDLLQAEIAQLRVPVRACASPPPSRRRPRFAGSRIWSTRGCLSAAPIPTMLVECSWNWRRRPASPCGAISPMLASRRSSEAGELERISSC